MSNGSKPEQIESEIEAQREQLAATVDQLAAKLDVKAKAQARIATAKDAATTDDGRPRPEVLAAVGAIVASVIAFVVWRTRR